eukprot:CAMPEP_0206545206 /NCGR_PEP_ID=MMETSP0325_2-20121206/11997_1 /ASSEMBLY_ACC=CAM_ASM_000347 /TAXON_ID=2866 /ORGANISM="Crypthecodinium cohnii, Strain Seligo" /LENGTH=984 /DNA_ID=CAMNT_0054044145 /DNA_START=125 /DNA_END=3076 /DNA_ORIENTATION=+
MRLVDARFLASALFLALAPTSGSVPQDATCSAAKGEGCADEAPNSDADLVEISPGVLSITTHNFRKSVELTTEAKLPLFVAFYDPRSVSYKELWPALQETGRRFRGEGSEGFSSSDEQGQLALLGICDVTVHTFLGLREAPLLESSWQSTARGPFKFGRSRFHPLIIMIYVQGQIMGEYVGVVSSDALVEVAYRLVAPIGGYVPTSLLEASQQLLERPGPFVWYCGFEEGSHEGNATDDIARKLHGHLVFVRAPLDLCQNVFKTAAPRLESPMVVWATSQLRASSVLREAAILSNSTSLRRWILSQRATIAQEMTPDNSHVFLDRPDPLLILLVDPEDKQARLHGESVLREVDQLFRLRAQQSSKEGNQTERSIQYVWSDCNAYAAQFDVEGKCPIVILVNPVDMAIKVNKTETWASESNITEISHRLLQWLHRATESWWPMVEEARENDPESQGPDQSLAPLVILARDRGEESEDDDDDEVAAAGQERKTTSKSNKNNIDVEIDDDDGEDEDEGGLGEGDDQQRIDQQDPDWYSNLLEQDDNMEDDELPAAQRFRNFQGLLAMMADFKRSFEARHAQHVDFDWSELKNVQELDPNMALLVAGPRAISRALKEGPGAMKPIWARIEERAALLAGLSAWDGDLTRKRKKNKGWRKLRERLKEGYRRLRVLFVKLFRTLETLSRNGQLPTEGRNLSVARESAKNLTVRDFVEKYAARGQPVIIQDLNLTAQEWSLDYFKKTCDRFVRLKQKNSSMWSWGKLEDAGVLPLSEFIDTFTSNETRRKWYLHDWPLPANCPDVFGAPPFEGFIVPKYFAGDYFQRAPFIGYQHTWPSLFVGSEETESALHVDSGGTNFWLYLLSGKKEWKFFSHLDMINLYHLPMSEHYFIDVFNSTSEEFPLLKHADLYTGIQEPGDLMFIPGGNPHGVRNLEAIHGISMNYVDASNIGSYLWTQLQEEHWVAFELFTDNSSLPHGLRSAQEDVTFGAW